MDSRRAILRAVKTGMARINSCFYGPFHTFTAIHRTCDNWIIWSSLVHWLCMSLNEPNPASSNNSKESLKVIL